MSLQDRIFDVEAVVKDTHAEREFQEILEHLYDLEEELETQRPLIRFLRQMGEFFATGQISYYLEGEGTPRKGP